MDFPIPCPFAKLNEQLLFKLQMFVARVQLGLFEEASSYFSNSLRGYEYHFSVFMEYAKMQLMRDIHLFATAVNRFRFESLPRCDDTNRVDVEYLLRLMEALAWINVRGISQEKLNVAFEFWNYMTSTYSVNSPLGINNIHVNAIEMYMRIIMTVSSSNQLEVPEKYLNVPLQLPPMLSPSSGCWYKYLITHHMDWEALWFQSIVLPNLDAKDAMEGFMRNDLFATRVDQNEAEEMTPGRMLLDLDTSNKICEYLLEKQPRLLSLAEAYLDASRFFKEMLYRKRTLIDINQGRPLLRVKELEDLVNQRRSSNSQ